LGTLQRSKNLAESLRDRFRDFVKCAEVEDGLHSSDEDMEEDSEDYLEKRQNKHPLGSKRRIGDATIVPEDMPASKRPQAFATGRDVDLGEGLSVRLDGADLEEAIMNCEV